MPIPSPSPVIIPPNIEEKIFNDLWVLGMRVKAPSPTTGSILFEVCPYDSISGEILPNLASREYVNLWEAVAEIPEVALAMQSVFDSIPAVLAWIEAKKNPPEPIIEDPPPEGGEEPPPEGGAE